MCFKELNSLENARRYITAIRNLFLMDMDDLSSLADRFFQRYDLREPDDIEHVLPRYLPPLIPSQYQHLVDTVIPLHYSADLGLDLYIQVVDYICSCNT